MQTTYLLTYLLIWQPLLHRFLYAENFTLTPAGHKNSQFLPPCETVDRACIVGAIGLSNSADQKRIELQWIVLRHIVTNPCDPS